MGDFLTAVLTPVKIVDKGRVVTDLLDVFLANSRAASLMKGDLMAQVAANNLGARRLSRFVERYGVELYEEFSDRLIKESEDYIKRLIQKMPRGTFSYTDYYDDYGPGTSPICAAVDITIDNEKVIFDFSRSSNQVEAGLNSYMNFTRAYAMFAVRIYTDPFVPQNEGMFSVVEVRAREGCFFNPSVPAPSGGRSTTQARILDIINGALAQAMPEKAMAAFSNWGVQLFSGRNPETGETFVANELLVGGWGATSGKDGLEALSIQNTAGVPVEVMEAKVPLRVRRHEFIPDSAGRGKYRGGFGVRKDIEVLTDDVLVILNSDRYKYEPYGLFGGGPGRLGRTFVNPDNGPVSLESKTDVLLKKGDVLSVQLSGAGGFGNPEERSSEAIRRDIEDGLVTAHASYP